MADRIPDPTLMARLQLSVKGVDWAASLVASRQHERTGEEWSAHQHVYHLLATEPMFQERIRRVIREERPTFAPAASAGLMGGYTEDEEITVLAERFMKAREETVGMLKELGEQDWLRTGVMPDGREVDLAWLAERVLAHALDHFVGLLNIHGKVELRQAQQWMSGAGS
jgi:hypothetical protein